MDQFITEVTFTSSSVAEAARVQSFLIRCYTNLAIVYLKTKNYDDAIKACTEALSLDDRNVKALYLRSEARIIPKSCGAAEEELALQDMKRALKIEPENRLVR